LTSNEELDRIVVERFGPIEIEPGVIKKFDTFAQLDDFVNREIEYWNDCAGSLPQLWQALSAISGSLHQASSGMNLYAMIDQAHRHASNERNALIYSSSPRAKFLKSLHQQSPNWVSPAYAYFRGILQPGNFATSDYLSGVFAAILSEHPAVLSAGIHAEIETSSGLRKEMARQAQLTSDEIKVIRDQFAIWKLSAQSEFSQTIDQNRSDFQNEHSEWRGKLIEAAESLDAAKKEFREAMDQLRSLYNEKLRLEQPATYWKELETKYGREGLGWVIATLFVVAVLVKGVWSFIYTPPNILKADAVTLSGLKGAVVIGAAISMVIYLINLLAKLATSAYHLSRDARERYQLTHVFLALANDRAVDPEERKIILSALFSRADSGLLKHEASPEMPLGAILAALKVK